LAILHPSKTRHLLKDRQRRAIALKHSRSTWSARPRCLGCEPRQGRPRSHPRWRTGGLPCRHAKSRQRGRMPFRRPLPRVQSRPSVAAVPVEPRGDPWLAASNNAPRMCGCADSKSHQISFSARRRSSWRCGKVRRIAQSTKSGRVITSSMPFRIIGRAAWNSTSSRSELANRKTTAATASSRAMAQFRGNFPRMSATTEDIYTKLRRR
jgi:hypothetical protein